VVVEYFKVSRLFEEKVKKIMSYKKICLKNLAMGVQYKVECHGINQISSNNSKKLVDPAYWLKVQIAIKHSSIGNFQILKLEQKLDLITCVS